jgi:hypothetical protein
MAKQTTASAIVDEPRYIGGAFGAGLALIVLPCVALYFGMDRMDNVPAVGLPILAVFGIMILFGALALVSTLFARLGLADSAQALALPEGSIRAAIALALIVLFAIISIMLYQSISKPYVIPGLRDSEKAALVKEPTNRVLAVVPECATKPVVTKVEDCAAPDLRYSVHLRQSPAQESTDLAKQLLILVGTLMTSVTSFYFATRAAELKRKDEGAATGTDQGDSKSPLPSSPQTAEAKALAAGKNGDENLDGCGIPVVDATPDEDLPASRGGVA